MASLLLVIDFNADLFLCGCLCLLRRNASIRWTQFLIIYRVAFDHTSLRSLHYSKLIAPLASYRAAELLHQPFDVWQFP
ncbi:hypothetical protein CW304_27965 [Bacillus sp. UFRGS-B20]|nr:hypothetical protein CW304_27965 [Bacillus sp. UFRGS-B20]